MQHAGKLRWCCGPEVLFETCVTMKFLDDDDDDDELIKHNISRD